MSDLYVGDCHACWRRAYLGLSLAGVLVLDVTAEAAS